MIHYTFFKAVDDGFVSVHVWCVCGDLLSFDSSLSSSRLGNYIF